MNASATPADRTRALQQLYKLQMHNKEAIINFVSRFRNQIQVLSNTTTNPQDMPTDKELPTFFIDKLCANASITGDVRHILLDCKRELHSPASSQTLTAFEDQLCLAKSQAFRGSTSSSSSPSHPIICEFCGKKGHTKQVRVLHQPQQPQPTPSSPCSSPPWPQWWTQPRQPWLRRRSPPPPYPVL
jgi:hypothetical protein